MSDPMAERPVPKPILAGAAGLVAFAILAAGYGALERSDRPTDVLAPAAEIVSSRSLTFEDRADTGVTVRDHATGDVAGVLEARTQGFARSILRVLAAARKEVQVGPEAPMTLTRWSDGRLTLSDPSTGEIIQLTAFGRSNADVFAPFLNSDSAIGRVEVGSVDE